MNRIYLDYAATTPILPSVSEAMTPWQTSKFGNPSSLHEEGRQAQAALDEAREIISAALQSEFAGCLFTSSGTEAANLAIIGHALANIDPNRSRILLTSIEHHCVLHTAPILERLGYSVELLPVDENAVLDIEFLQGTFDERVLLVSVMHANNEVGTIQPIHQVAELAKRHGATMHCDAVQTFGKLPVGLDHLEADLISVSGHKVSGPKGVGALVVRAGTKVKPTILGGSQERELRAGTQNVAGIVGFGKAVSQFRFEDNEICGAKRDHFRALVCEKIDAMPTVSEGTPCLTSHLHLRFPGVQNETLLIRLDRMGVSVSAGAACSAGSIDPSHVLLALGLDISQAKEGIRFTFSARTTDDEVRQAASRVVEAVNMIRRR